jgi:uncharacterized protein (TIGR03083 family)
MEVGMDSDTIWRHHDDQCERIADLLDGLDDAQWVTPSLCDGWTVCDVAAHLSHSQFPKARMMWEAVRFGFRFNTMIHRIALQDERSREELIAAIRAACGSRKRPPGTAPADRLMDVLVHGQDIAVPLGIDLPMPPDAAATVARHLWTKRFPWNPRRRLRGMTIAATDADFRVGEGRLVEAPIGDIVLLFTGRRAGALAGLG